MTATPLRIGTNVEFDQQVRNLQLEENLTRHWRMFRSTLVEDDAALIQAEEDSSTEFLKAIADFEAVRGNMVRSGLDVFWHQNFRDMPKELFSHLLQKVKSNEFVKLFDETVKHVAYRMPTFSKMHESIESSPKASAL